MKRVNLLSALVFSLSLTSFVACNDQDFSGADASLSVTAIDEAQASSISDQIVSTVDEFVNVYDVNGFQKVSEMQKVMGVSIVDSITITIDQSGPTIFPKVMCINFGTTGFTDKRGNVLKGKVYITISGRMITTGSYREMVFSNFFLNDNSVKGFKKVTFLGLTGSSSNPVSSVGLPSWNIVAKDTILRADGTTVLWNTDRTRTRISNNETPLIYWDDTYSITGTSKGVNAKGIAYSMVVDTNKPLIAVGGWRYFVSGAVITTTQKRTALLDFGDGTKDDKATVTINGVTKEIKLKR